MDSCVLGLCKDCSGVVYAAILKVQGATASVEMDRSEFRFRGLREMVLPLPEARKRDYCKCGKHVSRRQER
jgi:hypothetical protein